MATLRGGKRLGPLFLEGSLILAVFYALAYVTSLWVPATGEHALRVSILGVSLLFTGALVTTRMTHLGERPNLRRDIVVFSIVSVVVGLLAFATFWALLDGPRLTSLLLLEGTIAVPLSVAVWRWLAIRYEVYSPVRERVLIVGTGHAARRACEWIVDGLSGEYTVVGFADADDARVGQLLTHGTRVLTDYDSLVCYCPGQADRVLVALDEMRGHLPVAPLLELRLSGIEVEESTSFFERTQGKICMETLLPSWLIFGEGFKTSRWRSAAKRLVDVAHAIVLLVLTWPLMAIIALAIRLESPGPILYRQRRMGLNRHEFEVLKFRSMVDNAEGESGPRWAERADPRVTRVGAVIRKLRFDELPQLINVLRGEMSFVGPRPERRHFVEQLERRTPYYGVRMTVRPGLTGWAQVHYGYAASEHDAAEKLKYDLYYIKNQNPLLDLWISLKTVRVVLTRRGV